MREQLSILYYRRLKVISKVILLVEDNPSDIDLTMRALARGHITNELVIARDGKEALDYLQGEGKLDGKIRDGMPTLTLLDIKLPKVDGLEVLRRIRGNESTHRLPVVMLTSSDEERDIATSYDLGVNSYIRKPVDFNQFVESIQQLGLYWLVINEPPPLD
jgi:two-component system, response regulator